MIKISARFIGKVGFRPYDIYKLNFWTLADKVKICENVTLKYKVEYRSYKEFSDDWEITNIHTGEAIANTMAALDCEYWKKRALAAEAVIDAMPCIEVITNEQVKASNEWHLLRGMEPE